MIGKGDYMGKCISCHREIGDFLFCQHCGERQACAECGVQFDAPGSFCSECGVKRNVPKAQQSETTVGSNQAEPHVQGNHQSEQTTVPHAATVASHDESIQQPGQNAASNQSSPKTNKQMFWVIGGILAAIIIFFIYQSLNSGPEQVVKKFFKAANRGDIEQMEKYVHPELRGMGGYTPYGTGFLIENLVDIKVLDISLDYREENYAEYEVMLRVDHFLGSETERVWVEMVPYRNKWYIYDMY